MNFISGLLEYVEVAGVEKQVIRDALHSDLADFEDAIQESAAKRENIPSS
ncbi:MAG: hypothetical protein KC418_04555 [Anaerolineales bacterium]|nr:hypothetical protein [Anaerolineales bacterium]MCB8952245.1 hypothetical protein [Ardenticatenales bacterium]